MINNKPQSGDSITQDDKGIIARALAPFQQFLDTLVSEFNQLQKDFADYVVFVGTRPMNWQGRWVSKEYKRNMVVRDGIWTMIASTLTLDKPAPVAEGSPTYVYGATPAFVDGSFLGPVQSGHIYTFTDDGWIASVRVWAPEVSTDTDYNVLIVTDPEGDNPVVSLYRSVALAANAWTTITSTVFIIETGIKIAIYLEAANSSSSTIYTGNWGWGGPSQPSNPAAGEWNTDQQSTMLRINLIDDDAVSRTADLMAIVTGSTVEFTSTGGAIRRYYTIAPPVNNGVAVTYSVVLQASVGALPIGTLTEMTATVPVPSLTKYSNIAGEFPGSYPAWATIEGYLRLGDTVQPGVETTGYGVDVLFQPGTVSPDWELVARSIVS